MVNNPWLRGIVTIPCIFSLLPKEHKRTLYWGLNKLITGLSLLKDASWFAGNFMTSSWRWVQSPEEGVPFWPLWRLQSTVLLNSLKGTDEGTKQYERFRDTIFLNYWAIVLVKDVEFLFFSILLVLFVFFFVIFSFSKCLNCLLFALFFHHRIFLAFLF